MRLVEKVARYVGLEQMGRSDEQYEEDIEANARAIIEEVADAVLCANVRGPTDYVAQWLRTQLREGEDE
ncbi:MAG: hypothetical protein GWN53_17105 [Gammaproteobacteria bacterium]|uniref:Uncharacterized protein n=1 Tax=Candidatus Kutchimonas denitrificans TaxID=3056748 RepID=A0AAE4ZAR0_9BACT|nr:hypothetical protein [Candidatus Kutchimonas denitrificans]NIV53560.1 hypothetical protein [Gammaproteobacteria bacterium]